MKKKLSYRFRIREIVITSLLLIGTLINTSCVNDHCNEPMYSVLHISFYSEMDTTQQYFPIFLSFQGMNTDSAISVSQVATVSLPLNAEQETAKYKVLFVNTQSSVLVMKVDSLNNFYSVDGLTKFTLKEIKNLNLYQFNEVSIPLYYLSTDVNYYSYFYVPFEDTLSISYQNKMEFVSAECGYKNTYELKNAILSQGTIGSITIDNSLINSQSNEKNIRLFLEN